MLVACEGKMWTCLIILGSVQTPNLCNFVIYLIRFLPFRVYICINYTNYAVQMERNIIVIGVL